MPEATTEQLAAGEPHGLPPELCARLQGETPEELAADAADLATEYTPPPPPAPNVRVGGPRGKDVASHGSGTVAAGAAAYRERHGLDEDGKRPERRAATSNDPFRERSYSFDGG
ncbi:hypothetical protein [Streptomyces sp. NPDC007883]|uniref:hypothetical protein n=1 Tax=Streptomyces sp. NPDC007883 TaxID=3155116 RepID=UPI0033C2E9D3